MTIDRRRVLGGGAAMVAAAAVGAGEARKRAPVLGLILPPAKRAIPEEGIAMYGDTLRFVVTGLGIERMTPDSFVQSDSPPPINEARQSKSILLQFNADWPSGNAPTTRVRRRILRRMRSSGLFVRMRRQCSSGNW